MTITNVRPFPVAQAEARRLRRQASLRILLWSLGLGVLALVASYVVAMAQQTVPDNIGGGVYNSTPPTLTSPQAYTFQFNDRAELKTTTQPASMVSGTANTTGTGTTSLISAVTSRRLYVVAFSCANTGSTTSLISFQDGSSGTTLWTTIVPAGGGSNTDGSQPLFKTTAGNALFFIAASASTTVYCSAAGYSGL